jgi:RNA polymerase sigma-70 factor (ECF subfamily)
MGDAPTAVDPRTARFLILVETYSGAMRRLAAVYARTEQDREDLLQEVLLALWRALPAFRGDASERTWLYRIAHNVGIRHSARRRRYGTHEQPIDGGFGEVRMDDPGDRLEGSRRWTLVSREIRQLPPIDRQVIVLHLEGLSHREIAEVVGISAGACATRLSRVRGRLTERLETLESGVDARAGRKDGTSL